MLGSLISGLPGVEQFSAQQQLKRLGCSRARWRRELFARQMNCCSGRLEVRNGDRHTSSACQPAMGPARTRDDGRPAPPFGSESSFGWCDFIISTDKAVLAPNLQSFRVGRPATRAQSSLRGHLFTNRASKRTTNLGRAAAFLRARWSTGARIRPQGSTLDQAS